MRSLLQHEPTAKDAVEREFYGPGLGSECPFSFSVLVFCSPLVDETIQDFCSAEDCVSAACNVGAKQNDESNVIRKSRLFVIIGDLGYLLVS